MKKLQSKKTRILLSLLLCISLSITGVFACPWDPECDGPDTCHIWETEDGPVNHHNGPFNHFHDSGTIEPGDPNYCPGNYRVITVFCEACGSFVVDSWDYPPEHDYVLNAPDLNDKGTWYLECIGCGYITPVLN